MTGHFTIAITIDTETYILSVTFDGRTNVPVIRFTQHDEPIGGGELGDILRLALAAFARGRDTGFVVSDGIPLPFVVQSATRTKRRHSTAPLPAQLQRPGKIHVLAEPLSVARNGTNDEHEHGS